MESIEKQKLEIAVEEKELQTKEFIQGFSKRKRVLFLTFAILIIPTFFITKYVTAQIYLYNFAKTQITSHPAILTSLPIDIVETKALTILNDQYSAYALIKNQNKDLVATELNYTFTFTDDSGQEITKQAGETFLLGGEQKYLIIPNIKLKAKPIKVTVTIEDPTWKRRFSIPNVVIKAGIPTAADTQDPEGFAITGNIQNQSNSTIGQILISGIVFNAKNEVIAVTQRIENNLKPKDIRDYRLFWPLPIASQMAGLPRIITETNVLDSNNLR